MSAKRGTVASVALKETAMLRGKRGSRGTPKGVVPRVPRHGATFQQPLPPSDAELARDLAYRVRRLAVSGRTDPEIICIEKYDIAAELNRLANRLKVGR